MASNTENDDVTASSPSNTEEATDYLSMTGVNPNPMVLLIQFEKIDGEPLSKSLLTPRHLGMFCMQYAGEHPYGLEFRINVRCAQLFQKEF